MKDFFLTLILIIIILLIIFGIFILGSNLYNDLNVGEVASSVQNSIEDILSYEPEEKQNDYQNQISTNLNILEEIQSSNKVEDKNITYINQESNNNYFYNQLEDASKTIYNGLKSNIENMKTGTYKVEFGNTFSNILSKENGQKILGDYYQSAVEAFMYDNPKVFYLNVNKMYLNVESTKYVNRTTYNVYISQGNQKSYLADGFSSKEQINACEKQIYNVRNQVISELSGTNYDKVKTIHDYLVDNISYDTTISKNNIYNMYGALVNKECVCEGYSKAFKYLLDEAGIQNVIVIGKGTNSEGKNENHSWNYVLLNNNWYAIDVTWDDPVIRGGGRLSNSSKYKYFLKGLNTIGKDHTPNGQFTTGGKVFKYPDLSSRDY